MKVAIIGRTEILFETVNFFVGEGYNVPLIITANEAVEYTKTSEDFKALADSIGARFLNTTSISSSESIEFIESCGEIDIGVSFNYSSIISQDVINRFRLGVLNAHGGDLPRYRGNACQAWAMLSGERKIGLCVHRMIGGEVDSGDIIAREYLDIDINSKIGEVWEWMEKRIPELFLSSVRALEIDSDFIVEKQSKNPKDALRCYPRRPEDGRIDWSQDSRQILRLINASSKPYAGAFCYFEKRKIVIWNAELYGDDEVLLAVPGQVVDVDRENNYIIVATGKGKIKINSIGEQEKVIHPVEVIRSIRCRLV